jgi:Fe-S-cluster-containing hydrogenase component 2
MKVKRKIIQIDEELCDGCGLCVPSCAEGSLQIIDGKAKVVADNLCDGLGACLGECPTGALKVVEREAEEFDEQAVDEYLSKQAVKKEAPESSAVVGGCPSARLKQFAPSGACQNANIPKTMGKGVSALGHWPVQIRLIPPTAPFLKGADLLIAADCVPTAFSDFHARFLKGRVVMIGCPKFDDAADYIERFTEIFKNSGIKSITSIMMEVPCCSGLSMIIEKALANSKADIPLEEVVISTRGELLETRKKP